MSEEIVELNIGGSFYATSRQTLLSPIEPNDLFHDLFETKSKQVVRDANQRVFIDRNGDLFKFILDYLRNDGKLVLPDRFDEFNRLKLEAGFFKMNHLEKLVDDLIEKNRNRKKSILTTEDNDDLVDSTTQLTGLNAAHLDIHRNKTSFSISSPSPLITNKNWSKNYSGCIIVGYVLSFI
jgi:hypothetical protein